MTTKLETLEDGGQQSVMGGDGFDAKIVITEVTEAVDSFWAFYHATKKRIKGLEAFIESQYPPLDGLNPLIKEDQKEIEIRQKHKRKLQRALGKFYALENALDVASQKFRDEWGLSGEENEA